MPLRILGAVLFLVAFVLPVCDPLAGGGMGNTGPLYGYLCALLALPFGLISAAHLLSPISLTKELGNLGLSSLFLLAGLTNPLVLAYVSGTMRRPRLVAIMVLLGIVASWAIFVMMKMVPLIGHFLWVAGMLLLLAPELLKPELETAGSPDGIAA